ncbi:MAG: MBL fold metallo-hydrolase [Candidatus Latescibacteria bacterium]|jgi:glyoxylase-like metal-dependent hydrolase (beta-lactamase superfamily II)|nr:MBL fold metallo-hydrolase [Candidatus Latescibacterota bacterium]
MQTKSFKKILPDLYLFKDACNVYILKDGDEAIAIDFGSGAWLDALPEIGVAKIQHVLLTHAHRDQCYGLASQDAWPFDVHCSNEDARFFRTDRLQTFWHTAQSGGCPANYSAPRNPLPCVKGDLGESSELHWRNITVGAVPTPGHTRGALTYVVNWRGKSIVFCGDAAHSEGTVHQPYHLEWDHWTGEGALAAWHGLERLGGCRIDVLCPSHGLVVKKGAQACVRQSQRRLMAFLKAKGSVCAGAVDHWFPIERLDGGIARIVPDLYLLGGNTYLLAGKDGEGLIVDPTLPSIERIGEVMRVAGVKTISVAMATHYHRDHSDGLNWVRNQFGAKIWLHPWVAEPLRDRNVMNVPWLPTESIVPDRRLPEEGAFRWNQYRFNIRPFPGQTRWHCAFDTEIFGLHVLFSGDNFQPPTRWNGTGGFCAFNGSSFEEGFGRSAQIALSLNPDLICNGHGCVYKFDTGHYRRILKWSVQVEKSVRELCPSNAWLNDYDPRAMCWTPFRSKVKAGQIVSLAFQVQNYGRTPMQISVSPVLPDKWKAGPARRKMTVVGKKTRSVHFDVRVPRNAESGRYVIAGEVVQNGNLIGEAAVAIVDVVV